jgi:hypothetical protein
VQDYLSRNFHLVRLESCFEISQDLESCISKMSPKFSSSQLSFEGWSRMGVKISKLQMHEVLQP